ncbi:MAG TPA: hypothetical protein VHJ79_18825 [Mycobacterium sp.]|nr:hypothetical protein [Mycobacterium sp.]
MSDFANAWQAADKVVYSTTVAVASTANTGSNAASTPARYAT